MITKERYLECLAVVIAYRNQIEKEYNEIKEHCIDIIDENLLINDSRLSRRSKNILYVYFITKGIYKDFWQAQEELRFKDLKGLTTQDLLMVRNSGKKVCNEIKDFAKKADINIF